jgi:hypothetical protein
MALSVTRCTVFQSDGDPFPIKGGDWTTIKQTVSFDIPGKREGGFALDVSEENLLWCLIQGDREAFKVVPPLCSCIDVDDLKRVIQAGIKTVPPKDLILWKVWAMSQQS